MSKGIGLVNSQGSLKSPRICLKEIKDFLKGNYLWSIIISQ